MRHVKAAFFGIGITMAGMILLSPGVIAAVAFVVGIGTLYESNHVLGLLALPVGLVALFSFLDWYIERLCK